MSASQDRLEGCTSIPAKACFIVGVSRSGTSLLLSLFDGHPEVLAVPLETKVFQWNHADDPVAMFWRRTQFEKRLLVPGSPERATFERELRARLSGPVEFDQALSAVVAATARVWPQPSAKVWIEKTPRHRNQLPMLLERFQPGATALAVVRDPRGCFASHKARWNRRGRRAARRFARRWLAVHALSQHFVRRERGVVITRYEDFVLNTEGEMARLAAHIGITSHACLSQPSKLGDSWSGNSSYDDGCTREAGLAQERDAASEPTIDQDGVDRWREYLEPEEIETLESLLGPAMECYGYEPSLALKGTRRLWLDRWRLNASSRLLLSLSRRRWHRANPGQR